MLSGKIAWVTGAGSGIGQGVCKVFAREGANVVITDINVSGCNQTLEEIQSKYGTKVEHKVIETDVTNTNSIKETLKFINDSFGKPPSIVVNAAGICTPAHILKLDEELFDRIINVNLKGTFLVNKFAITAMKEANISDGSIVNISSNQDGQAVFPGFSAYAASKGGVSSFTDAVGKEVAKFGIRVNAISPGCIASKLSDDVYEKLQSPYNMDDKDIKLVVRDIAEEIPVKRFGDPEDVGELAAFLASPRSSFITATIMYIDGGMKGPPISVV